MSSKAKYYEFKGRMATFLKRGWEHADDLAKAGFISRANEKFKDCIKCVYCGMKLQNWRNYDPIKMHSSTCEYMRRLAHDMDLRSLRDEIGQMKDEKMCRVCYQRAANRVCLPCGHFNTCHVCTDKLIDCPMCRRRIIALVPVKNR